MYGDLFHATIRRKFFLPMYGFVCEFADVFEKMCEINNDNVQICRNGCATFIPMTQRVCHERGHLSREKTSSKSFNEKGL